MSLVICDSVVHLSISGGDEFDSHHEKKNDVFIVVWCVDFVANGGYFSDATTSSRIVFCSKAAHVSATRVQSPATRSASPFRKHQDPRTPEDLSHFLQCLEAKASWLHV